MSPEQITAVLTGVAGVIVAIGVLVHNITELRKDLNGRLSQLLASREEAARKDGELAGRDYMKQRPKKRAPAPIVVPDSMVIGTNVPVESAATDAVN